MGLMVVVVVERWGWESYRDEGEDLDMLIFVYRDTSATRIAMFLLIDFGTLPLRSKNGSTDLAW